MLLCVDIVDAGVKEENCRSRKVCVGLKDVNVNETTNKVLVAGRWLNFE